MVLNPGGSEFMDMASVVTVMVTVMVMDTATDMEPHTEEATMWTTKKEFCPRLKNISESSSYIRQEMFINYSLQFNSNVTEE